MDLVNIFIKGVFIDNMIFAYFLGMCSYLAVSKTVTTANGLGLAVIFVLGITVPVNYILENKVLKAGALQWLGKNFVSVDLNVLSLIMFIAVVSAMVQLVEMIIEKFSPALYSSLGIFLPLIAVNCAILGGALFMQERQYSTIIEATSFALGSGVGWYLAIVAIAAIREKIKIFKCSSRAKRFRNYLYNYWFNGYCFHVFHGNKNLIMIYTIFAAVVFFLLVILTLVSVLLFAKSKLLPSGEVTLTINGQKDIRINPGGTILGTLGDNKIFLPSACGGGGTCAMCKCQVNSGGGEILPTEKPYFSRKEIQDNWRLGCQVKIKNDMDINIPEEIFGIKKWECEVVSNYSVASFIKEFVVKLPEGENLDFKAGGYIQIDVPEVEVPYKNIDISPSPQDPSGPEKFKGEWDKFKLWDLKMKNEEPIFRAYSMANHPAEGNIVMLNIRIATPPWDRSKNTWMDVNPGICSSYVYSLKAGDKVTVSGPYGEFFIKETENEMVYIGGGAGMAPMRSHLFHLFHTMKTDRKVTFYYGGRSKENYSTLTILGK